MISREKLYRNRKEISVRLYSIIFLIAAAGGVVGVILSRPEEPILKTTLYIGSVLVLLEIMLWLTNRYFDNKYSDYILFLALMIFYIFVMLLDVDIIPITNMIWLPVFVVMMYATMNYSLTRLFLIFHLLVNVFFYFFLDHEVYIINDGTYIVTLTVSIIVLVSAQKFVRLFNTYQKEILDSNDVLKGQISEIHALNEQYEAADRMLKNQLQEINHLAIYDSLTGLFNRNGFIEQLEEQIEAGKALYVTLGDIHNFGEINHLLGYEVGDMILKEVGQIISSDTSVMAPARLHGDLFAVIGLEEASEDEVNKILKNDHFIMNHVGQDIEIGFDFGIVKVSVGDSSKECLKKAMIALDISKKSNYRNITIYDNSIDENNKDRIKMTADLSHAIRNDDLEAVFQPIVNGKTNKLVGYETLARWKCKDRGNVSPNIFIPIAEKADVIEPLTWCMIAKAVNFCRCLIEVKRDAYVSVNLSAALFVDTSFSDKLVNFIQTELGENFSSIAFEVTESIYLKGLENVTRQLINLRNKGYKIYLDDFGTGYASLGYIKHLPLDVMKIDKLFVKDILTDRVNQNILASIVVMANGLNMELIAEGVENCEELDYILSTGISLVQGYHYSQPLCLEDAINWLLY